MAEPRLLRPMGYGEIFNEAFDLYKRNFALFAGISAIVYLPFALILVLVANSPILRGFVAIALLIFAMLVEGAIVKALADRYLGRDVTIGEAWRYVFRRAVPYSIASFLVYIALGIGLALFIIPGIIVAFQVYFLPAVMIVEDRFGRDGRRRSRELASGQWLRIFVIALLSLIAYLVFYGLAGALGYGLLAVLNPGTVRAGAANTTLVGVLVGQLLEAAARIVAAPIMTAVMVLLYFDVRVRKEGFDVELLAQEMGDSSTGTLPYRSPA